MSRVNNSSTFRGWLESTGLDDILVGTCVCLGLGPDELPPAAREQQNQRHHPQVSQPTNKKWVEVNDHIYRLVKESNSNIQHCIWPIRSHYTFVSTNEQFAPNEDDLAMVQRPSTITILYMILGENKLF